MTEDDQVFRLADGKLIRIVRQPVPKPPPKLNNAQVSFNVI